MNIDALSDLIDEAYNLMESVRREFYIVADEQQANPASELLMLRRKVAYQKFDDARRARALLCEARQLLRAMRD